MISMLIIITHFGCKKDACKDCTTNQPPNPPPIASTAWTRLQHLPDHEFSSGDWFDGENFLLGIKNEVFAISIDGNVWQYNVAANSWSSIGSFPEDMPGAPVTFSINGMGYCIGNGHCWQYNPITNQWIRKNDPPARLAAPLVIGNKAYLRTDSNHLFAYEPTTDVYMQQKDPPDFGNYRHLAGYFVLNEHGYYIGLNGECWKYDASIDNWQRQASFTGIDNVAEYAVPAVSFSVNNDGYILGDFNNDDYNSLGQSLWRYEATLNKWTRTKDYYYGDGGDGIKAVSLDGVAYIGLGSSGGDEFDFKAIDFWSYK